MELLQRVQCILGILGNRRYMYNINKIKNELSNHTNEVVKIISYGNRNRVDECFA